MQVVRPFLPSLFFILMQLQQSNLQVRSSPLADFGQRSVHVFLANCFQSSPWFAFCSGPTSGTIWNSCVSVITWCVGWVGFFFPQVTYRTGNHIYYLWKQTIKWYSGTLCISKGMSLQNSHIKPCNYRVSSSLCAGEDHLRTPPLSLQLPFVEEVHGGYCEFAFHLGRAGRVPSKTSFGAASASSTSLGIGRDVGNVCCRKPLAGFCGKVAMSSRVLVSQLILSQRSVWSNDTSCGRPGLVHCLLLLFLGCDFSISVG